MALANYDSHYEKETFFGGYWDSEQPVGKILVANLFTDDSHNAHTEQVNDGSGQQFK